MKHSKKLAKLIGLQRWYDAQDKNYQAAHKRPGSVKAI